MASISSLGIGSGLDLNGLLDQLNDAERGKLEPIERQIESQQVQLSAYGELQGALSGFQAAVSALDDPSLFQSLSAEVSGEALQAAAGSDASPGRYDVTINALATAGSLATQRVDTLETELTDSEQTLTLEFGDNELNRGVTIAAGSTLEDVRDAINADPEAAVTASVVNDGEGYRLALMSDETGEQASITVVGFADIVAPDVALTDQEIAQAGQDASLEVNGIPIISASNQVEGAIQDVTLRLTQEGSSTVNVERDTRAVREAVAGFVTAYNSFKGTTGELTAFDSETGQAGELLGDSALRTVESRLRADLAGGVAQGGGEEGALAMLADVGISLQLDGSLALDEDRLNLVIGEDMDALGEFFAGNGETPGMANQLNETLGQLMSSNGVVENSIRGAENRIESLVDRYGRMEQGINTTIERYRTQFGQLDSMIAQMNQTSSYLTEQFDMMNAQLGRD
ncbi:flagellar filament capping protein FliD [Halomonas alkalisoli]|uniref:flagellar filament capping protein FliD n=1 Tax=Halomonas alkalisoli TaxID=2907158 RepID=UPI001F24B1E2|nr:flagellar filament capping protein FliD [Halomonas alkalisoli]MCE9682805.1 flagellar filament capping protein FliD [Halomonas alkalisoli]